MILSTKKISKVNPTSESASVRLGKPLQALKRASYTEKKTPQRFMNAITITRLESDVFFIEANRAIFCELSMLNNFMRFRSAEVVDDYNGVKVLKLPLQPKIFSIGAPWQYAVRRFESYGDNEMYEWARIIEDFSTKYELLIKQTNESNNGLKKEEMEQLKTINSMLNTQKSCFFKNFPCLEMVWKIRKGTMSLTELNLNETYIKHLGYQLNSFVSTVLHEGFPMIEPLDGTAMAGCMKDFMKNFLLHYTEGTERKSQLFLKTGYVEQFSYQDFIMTTIDEDEITISLFLVVLEYNTPEGKYIRPRYSKEFMSELAKVDKEKETFVNKYYLRDYKGTFCNNDKVCTIKDLY